MIKQEWTKVNDWRQYHKVPKIHYGYDTNGNLGNQQPTKTIKTHS